MAKGHGIKLRKNPPVTPVPLRLTSFMSCTPHPPADGHTFLGMIHILPLPSTMGLLSWWIFCHFRRGCGKRPRVRRQEMGLIDDAATRFLSSSWQNYFYCGCHQLRLCVLIYLFLMTKAILFLIKIQIEQEYVTLNVKICYTRALPWSSPKPLWS